MERGEGKPSQSIGEQSGSQFVTDLIHRQRLQIGDISSYYDSWVNLLSESAGNIPQQFTQTIRNTSLGLGFLFYNQWGEMGREGRIKQVVFQRRLQRARKYYGIDQVVFTHEQGQILRDTAAVVNVTYDPGEPEDTPENIKKRTFVFADLDDMPSSTASVVDADK
jgi:hypothetical protein